MLFNFSGTTKVNIHWPQICTQDKPKINLSKDALKPHLVNQGGLGGGGYWSHQASPSEPGMIESNLFPPSLTSEQGSVGGPWFHPCFTSEPETVGGPLLDFSPWLAQPAFLLYSGTQSQGWHLSKWTGSPNQLLIKKISYMPAYSVILRRHFLIDISSFHIMHSHICTQKTHINT